MIQLRTDQARRVAGLKASAASLQRLAFAATGLFASIAALSVAHTALADVEKVSAQTPTAETSVANGAAVRRCVADAQGEQRTQYRCDDGATVDIRRFGGDSTAAVDGPCERGFGESGVPMLVCPDGSSALVRTPDGLPFPSRPTAFDSDLRLGSLSEAELLQYVVEVTGSVRVEGFRGRDLAALSKLRKVGRDLMISGRYHLDSLDGLEGISEVPGDFTVESGFSLKSLAGLRNLETVGGGFSLGAARRLKSLAGLERLRSADYVSLGHLGSIRDFSALKSLRHVRELHVIANAQLTSLKGLNQLTELDTLRILGNDSLTDLTGLGGLTKVRREFIIEGNAKLRRLSGLNSLRAIGKLRIGPYDSNVPRGASTGSALRNLTGLERVEEINVLEIHEQPNLVDLRGLRQGVRMGSLDLLYNPLLASLAGIENSLPDSSGLGLWLLHNPRLTDIRALLAVKELSAVAIESDNLCESVFRGVLEKHPDVYHVGHHRYDDGRFWVRAKPC